MFVLSRTAGMGRTGSPAARLGCLRALHDAARGQQLGWLVL